MQNGTIEVPDSLPKRDYYTSLRRFTTGGRLGSLSGGSMLGVNGAGNSATMIMSPVNAVGTPFPNTTMGRSTIGRSQASALNFKPSGKVFDCAVIMLDGLQQIFSIDKAAYGQQLFDAVCSYLDLYEVDFFGIKYMDADHTMCWLKLDKRISKQVEKNWLFEFQVKFFPYDMDSLTEDLTRYYLCLQIRQNLLSGQLPCTFISYVILGSYVVQSDAGDYDSKINHGIGYIRDHPFAPQHLQSVEMLSKIAETHQLHHGQSPETADRNFLMNAKKLGLYGVHMHKVTSLTGIEHGLGVYYGGLLLYLGRIRLQRFSWPRIIKLSYRKRNFIIIVRRADDEQNEKTYVFRCATAPIVKRLWQLCVEHHNFFRLRGYERTKKPSILPGFSSRKYNYQQPGGGSGGASSFGETSPQPTRQQPIFRRSKPQRRQIPPTNDAAWFTLPRNVNDPSQYNYSGQLPNSDLVEAPFSPEWMAYNSSHINLSGKNVSPYKHGVTYGAQLPRPVFKPEPWRISTADRTSCLGIDDYGVDIAAQKGAGWQGCRANKGVKAPGSFVYESAILEDGAVRLGWATNKGSLNLGQDDQSFVFGNEDNSNRATVNFNGEKFDYGIEVKKGDVISCNLDLDQGFVCWSCNGEECPQVFRVPDKLIKDSFFPAVGLKNSRVILNFEKLEYVPKSRTCIPLSQVTEDQIVPNSNIGWRLNPYDASAAIDVRPDGIAAQSMFGSGWQGCRANRGVQGEGRYYFEAKIVESRGLARFGWSTEDGQLILGTDRFGFGYGADHDGFGLNGQQGKRMHNNEIENYGESFVEGDVIGCFLDLIQRTVKWAKNGHLFGDAYRLPSTNTSSNTSHSPVAYFPTISLIDSTVECNFGDSLFAYFPGPDWTPLSYACPENAQVSRNSGPKYKNRGWSYTDPKSLIELNSKILKPTVDRREDDVRNVKTQKLNLTGNITSPGMTKSTKCPVVTALNGDEKSANKREDHPPRTEKIINEDKSLSHGIDNVDSTQSITIVMSPTKQKILPKPEIDESVVIRRSEPYIQSECYTDKDGKVIKRTTKHTKVITTKTLNERFMHSPEMLATIPNDRDDALSMAIQTVTRLDPDVYVINTDLNNMHNVNSKKPNTNLITVNHQNAPYNHITPLGAVPICHKL